MKFSSNLNCDGKIVSEMGPSKEFRAWIRNYIRVKEWALLTQQRPNFKSSLAKPRVELGNWWKIFSRHKAMYVGLFVDG